VSRETVTPPSAPQVARLIADGGRIGAAGQNEVVLQMVFPSVEDEVDARIDSPIDDFSIGGKPCAPPRPLRSDEVARSPRQRVDAFRLRAAGAHQHHPDHVLPRPGGAFRVFVCRRTGLPEPPTSTATATLTSSLPTPTATMSASSSTADAGKREVGLDYCYESGPRFSNPL
jgi:hypothetical protein